MKTHLAVLFQSRNSKYKTNHKQNIAMHTYACSACDLPYILSAFKWINCNEKWHLVTIFTKKFDLNLFKVQNKLYNFKTCFYLNVLKRIKILV